MNTDFLGSPVLAIWLGQAIIILVLMLGILWLSKQLKFFGSMLMRESMKTAEENKVVASKVEEKLDAAAAEVKTALAEAAVQVPANPVLPIGTVVSMDVGKMDVKELITPTTAAKEERNK